MRWLSKLWLIALLAVAVPLQGFAAGASLHCDPAHSRAGNEPDDRHEHAVHALHHASHLADPDSDAADPSTQATCSACAACCTTAAMPAALFGFEPMRLHQLFEDSAAPSAAAFYTDGPDRPPRRPLA